MKTSRPRPPKDPVTALNNALREHNFDKAAHQLATHPHVLNGGDLGRAQIALAALGTPLLVTADNLDGWQWLDHQGFVFPTTPGEGFNKVMGHLLENASVPVLNAWRVRSTPTPITSALLTHAIQRHDTIALQWWADQGLPFEENPVGWGAKPWVLFTLSHHRLAHPGHVTFLLNHGVRPLPQQALDEPEVKLDSPLLWLARHYKEKEKRTASQTVFSVTEKERDAVTFRTMWLALCAAGDDPTYRNSLKECPEDLLRETTAASWWEAHQRQTTLHQSPPITAARRRLRS